MPLIPCWSRWKNKSQCRKKGSCILTFTRCSNSLFNSLLSLKENDAIISFVIFSTSCIFNWKKRFNFNWPISTTFSFFIQHFLYFFPLPHGHRSFLPTSINKHLSNFIPFSIQEKAYSFI